MKKIFLMAIVIALGVGFTGCKKKEKCWELKYELMGQQISTYVWGTEEQANAAAEAQRKSGVTVTVSESKKSQSECNTVQTPTF